MSERKPPQKRPATRPTSKPGARSSGSAGSRAGGGSPPRTQQGARPGKKPGKSIVNQKQTPWALIITIAVIVVFAAGIIVAVVVTSGGKSGQTAGQTAGAQSAGTRGGQIIPTTPTGQTTVETKPDRITNTSGIDGVLAWNTGGYPGAGAAGAGALAHDHVAGPVTYAVTPPVGGPHNAEWMNAGVYTEPIPAERAVHNMEHGAIWITYNPNIGQSEIDQLTAFVTKQTLIEESQQASGIADQANRFMDLSPWPTNSLPSPIVLSSWGFQLRVSSPTDPRMQQFVDTFRQSRKYTPEYGSAVDGIPINIGGRPASDGSRQPNPST